jgi:hypothetical protein
VPGPYDSSLTRVQPFFERAFDLDAPWLAALLAAAPAGGRVLGDRVDGPGEMLSALLGAHPKGKAPRACFEFEVLPGKKFLRWCVRHPEELTWPPRETYGEETTLKRRALLHDEPPGRSSVEQEALALIDKCPASTRAWWRFEGSSWIDCVIATDRVVITIEGKRTEPLSAATHWYPRRSQLVRNLEAARQLAKGRAWGTLLLSETPVLGGQPNELAASLYEAAPHLDDDERADLQDAYLGNLTWRQACEAVGVPFEELPATTADL